MIEKRDVGGLSTVIVTIIIILLTIVAVTIIWVIVKNVVVNQSENAGIQEQFFSENVKMVSLRVNGDLANISLQRSAGKIKSGEIGTKKQEVVTTEYVQDEDADIISVVDLSGSMAPMCSNVSFRCCRNNLDGNYNSSAESCSGIDESLEGECVNACGGDWVDKIASTKEANRQLIDILSEATGIRVGLVGYNTTTVYSAGEDLTNNFIALNDTINLWGTGGITCICCGINTAVKMLKQQSTDGMAKKIIIMSDGDANMRCNEQNTGNAATDAIKASCDAKTDMGSNLTVYTIGAGGEVNEATLRSIAECGGGKYFSAINVSELVNVYRSVAVEIKSSMNSTLDKGYFYIVFYDDDSSYREKITNIPGLLSIKNYQFDISGKLAGEIKKIEVYPAVVSKSGKEVIGSVADSWKA